MAQPERAPRSQQPEARRVEMPVPRWVMVGKGTTYWPGIDAQTVDGEQRTFLWYANWEGAGVIERAQLVAQHMLELDVAVAIGPGIDKKNSGPQNGIVFHGNPHVVGVYVETGDQWSIRNGKLGPHVLIRSIREVRRREPNSFLSIVNKAKDVVPRL